MDPGRAGAFDIGPLPEDSHARLIHLSNVFGRVLFDAARDLAIDQGGSLPDFVKRGPVRSVTSLNLAQRGRGWDRQEKGSGHWESHHDHHPRDGTFTNPSDAHVVTTGSCGWWFCAVPDPIGQRTSRSGAM